MHTIDEMVILVVEDDAGHARLIQKNLARLGLDHRIHRFEDGQEILDFLHFSGPGPHRAADIPYLMLLDIRLPRVDGLEVLRQVKTHEELQPMPVIMLTTSENPQEIDYCYRMGCGGYIVKPIRFDEFSAMIERVGRFLTTVRVPTLRTVN
jgi:CheY-like chemotaxis protein